jgi:hypothetical protein
MRFATGLSKSEDLAQAVVEAVAEVKATLGPDAVPTWIQLMVSGDYANPSAVGLSLCQIWLLGLLTLGESGYRRLAWGLGFRV